MEKGGKGKTSCLGKKTLNSPSHLLPFPFFFLPALKRLLQTAELSPIVILPLKRLPAGHGVG